MDQKNINIKELAYITGIKTGVLASYIDANRRSIPNIVYGAKIADALDTTVEYLVFGTKRKKCSVCEYESIVKKIRKLPTQKLDAITTVIEIFIKDDEK